MAKPSGRRIFWIYWGILTLAIGGYLAAGLFAKNAATNPLLSPARAMLLPGQTTHGHYQIELACEACHSEPFAGRDALQKSCLNCHAAELKAANDTHPKSKFTDPRNIDRLEKLDATQCVTCHTEHRPHITTAMGVTLPPDLCFHCHAEIGKDRPSHEGMAFNTCNSAGCHKYHDNRALYGDFLVKHAEAAALSEKRGVAARDFAKIVTELGSYPLDRYPLRKLTAADADAPAGVARDKHVMDDWLQTSHAAAGVNCSGCHNTKDAKGAVTWVQKPAQEACASCHQPEAKNFMAGRHGMRLAQGLGPMSPGMARLPMKADAHDKTLTCNSCHGAHAFDTRKAQVESCLGCHNDQHSLAYRGSPHHKLWQQELAGTLPAGQGVSCATCHMPRIEHRQEDIKRTLVQHNQSDTLRPPEKMIRPVCMSCHGLGFAIDALADPALARNNFSGKPGKHINSIEMAVKVEQRAEESRKREKAPQ